MDHFDTNDLQKPTEEFVVDDDNYAICILKFKGPFTFYDTGDFYFFCLFEHYSGEFLGHISPPKQRHIFFILC